MAASSFRVAAEAQGLASAIKTLGKVDKELKKELVASMKKAADPLVNEARSLVPAAAPLSNWGNWKGGWNTGKVTRGIKVSQRNTAQRGVGGQREETIRLLALVSSSAAGAIYDMAGRAGGSGRGSEGAARGRAMIDKLDTFGQASRTLWPAAERKLGDVQDAVRDAIADMEDTLQKELEAR
jgi:hypothetical protein